MPFNDDEVFERREGSLCPRRRVRERRECVEEVAVERKRSKWKRKSEEAELRENYFESFESESAASYETLRFAIKRGKTKKNERTKKAGVYSNALRKETENDTLHPTSHIFLERERGRRN